MSNKILGLICVQDEAGKTVFTEPLFDDQKFAWGDWSKAYEPKVIEKFPFPVLLVPLANIKWKRAHPLTCLYQATKGLLSNLFGTTLDQDDSKFFEEHPLATPSGVSLANTARVVQELIDPYGLRVSRIHLMPGTSLPGDLGKWVDILGMNPIAVGDHQTSNDLFAQMTDQDVSKVNQTYKMEFTEKPLRPAVFCAVAPMSATSKTGENLGHAEYVGARSKRQGFEPVLQLQVDRTQFVHWFKEPAFEDVSDNGSVEIDLWQSLAPNGKTMSTFYSSYAHSYPSQGFHPGSTRGQGPTTLGIVGSGKSECYICFEKFEKTETVGANCCRKCWNSFWRRYDCGDCKTALAGAPLLGLTNLTRGSEEERAHWLVKVKCLKCMEANELRANPGDLLWRLIKAVTGVKVVK